MEARSTWSERIFLCVLFSLIAALILTPLTSNHIVPHKFDYTSHITAITLAKAALLEGQFPLRIAQYHEWRYPLFQFYSPTTYTLAALIHLCTSNPFVAEKILLWFFLLLGGIYFYRLSYEFVPSRYAAILAAVAYLTMPNYLVVIHYNGGLNEALALGILPAVLFYTLQRYANPADNKTLLKTSLAWYLLITIHLVTFIIVSFFAGLLLFIMTCRNRQWLNLLDVAMAYVFACFLAMWYLMPIALLHNFFVVNRSFDSKIFYDLYKISASDLLALAGHLPPTITDPSKGSNALWKLHPGLGAPVILAVICSFCMLFKKPSKPGNIALNNKFNYWLPALLLVFASVFFLTWSPFNFWQYLPPAFFIFQYPSRLLGQSMWLGGLLFAGVLFWVFKDKLDARHCVLGVVVLIIISLAWFPGGEWKYINFSSIMKNPFLAFNNDYLLDTSEMDLGTSMHFDKPVTDKNKIPLMFAAVRDGIDPSAKLSVAQMRQYCQQENTYTICKVNVPDQVKLIELPILDYPGMLEISVNGQPVSYGSKIYNDLFIAAIKPVSGELNTISIRFSGSSLANYCSDAAWLIWFVFLFAIFARQ